MVALDELPVKVRLQWRPLVLRQLPDLLQQVQPVPDAEKLEPLLSLHLWEKQVLRHL